MQENLDKQINRSRRACLRWIMLLLGSSALPTTGYSLAKAGLTRTAYPATSTILQQARREEMAAYLHYQAYTEQALREDFPNIAYLFKAFATSEEVHAIHYETILKSLGQTPERFDVDVKTELTRKNLRKAAGKEMRKITSVYPDFLEQLEPEDYPPALEACRYSWLSHRQHEQQIKQIKAYSGWFFSKVADNIEGQDFHFHVCRSCGSTIASAPSGPCDICSLSEHNYQAISRPAS